MDFAEQVESVAYVICGEELITFEKFCQIWHVKGVSEVQWSARMWLAIWWVHKILIGRQRRRRIELII